MKRAMVTFLAAMGGVFAAMMLIAVVSLLASGRQGMGTGKGIGLVELKGMILDSRDTVRQLKEMRDNDRVKAVVLRIDSPGGVVAPSQEICEEVKKLVPRKRVVVSMGALAASGGYYVAAPASMIFANPGTLTGSIGVLLKLSNLQGLYDKVGVRFTTLKTGKYKDAGSTARPLTPEDRALLQGMIENSYGQFVQAVADGRKLPVAEVKKIADGRVFTGEQALRLRLVDRLGDLEDAVAEAAKGAGITGEPTIITPTKKKHSLLDLVLDQTTSKVAERMAPAGLGAAYLLEGF